MSEPLWVTIATGDFTELPVTLRHAEELERLRDITVIRSIEFSWPGRGSKARSSSPTIAHLNGTMSRSSGRNVKIP